MSSQNFIGFDNFVIDDNLAFFREYSVKTENHHYLNNSEKVLDVTEKAAAGVVIPHFRRGYFKRLNSNFYKNKKGQIVFVHETIVNGLAKTLVDNNE